MSKRVNGNGKPSRCNRTASRGLWKGKPLKEVKKK